MRDIVHLWANTWSFMSISFRNEGRSNLHVLPTKDCERNASSPFRLWRVEFVLFVLGGIVTLVLLYRTSSVRLEFSSSPSGSSYAASWAKRSDASRRSTPAQTDELFSELGGTWLVVAILDAILRKRVKTRSVPIRSTNFKIVGGRHPH